MRFVRRNVLTAFALLAFVYLMAPIAVVIAFSFNNPLGKFNYTWKGFTVDNWLDPFRVPGLADIVVPGHGPPFRVTNASVS